MPAVFESDNFATIAKITQAGPSMRLSYAHALFRAWRIAQTTGSAFTSGEIASLIIDKSNDPLGHKKAAKALKNAFNRFGQEPSESRNGRPAYSAHDFFQLFTGNEQARVRGMLAARISSCLRGQFNQSKPVCLGIADQEPVVLFKKLDRLDEQGLVSLIQQLESGCPEGLSGEVLRLPRSTLLMLIHQFEAPEDSDFEEGEPIGWTEQETKKTVINSEASASSVQEGTPEEFAITLANTATSTIGPTDWEPIQNPNKKPSNVLPVNSFSKKNTVFKRPLAWLMAAAFFSAWTLGGLNLAQQFFDAIAFEGPQIAADKKPDISSPEAIYGKAWAMLTAERYSEAESWSYEGLSLGSEKLKPRFYLVLGIVNLSTDRLIEAEHFLNLCHSIAEKDNDIFGLCFTTTYLAELNRKLGYLEISQSYLNDAFLLYQRLEPELRDRYIGDWYITGYELALDQKDFSKALALAQEGLYLSEINPAYKGFYLDNLAFAHALIGQYEQAQLYHNHAFKLLARYEDDKYYHFSKVVEIVINKCTGFPYEDLLRQLQDYAHENGRPSLERYLDIALSADCFSDQ